MAKALPKSAKVAKKARPGAPGAAAKAAKSHKAVAKSSARKPTKETTSVEES